MLRYPCRSLTRFVDVAVTFRELHHYRKTRLRPQLPILLSELLNGAQVIAQRQILLE